MNLQQYSRLLDEKVADAWYNWEQAEIRVKQAKAAYDSVMREKTSFEQAVEELSKKRPS